MAQRLTRTEHLEGEAKNRELRKVLRALKTNPALRRTTISAQFISHSHDSIPAHPSLEVSAPLRGLLSGNSTSVLLLFGSVPSESTSKLELKRAARELKIALKNNNTRNFSVYVSPSSRRQEILRSLRQMRDHFSDMI